jgi:putative hydrolases of HD superfamily
MSNVGGSEAVSRVAACAGPVAPMDRGVSRPTRNGSFNSLPRSLGDRSHPVVDLVVWFDRLKHVDRQNPTLTGGRPERTAEHSWHLAFAVYLLADYASEKIDVERAVLLAVLHDVPEALVGDTFVYGSEEASRRTREEAAIRELAARLPAELAADVVAKWQEYEFTRSAEGRFVMALDVLLPVLLNFSNIQCSSWVRHGVRADMVRERIKSVRDACPELADMASQLVDVAERDGDLR